jgi:predicted membrane chloride channel (bestrophin family)
VRAQTKQTNKHSRFLIAWLATLPAVLWVHVGWGVLPCVAAISFALVGLDEIAIQLEEVRA